MKKRLAVVSILLLTLGLAGCGETLEQRIANKETCHAAGGRYVEMTSGLDYSYRDWRCDLGDNQVGDGDE